MDKLNHLEKDGYLKFLAPAKINLFLKILSKRKDGYHNLQSIFQLINLFDELYFKPRKDSKISINDCKNIENNLVLKSARMILKDLSYGVDIILKKNIPIGSGLGGGSSDAALTLMVLNKLFNLNYSKKKLIDFSLKIGADVPFFIFGKNALVEGIGQKLTPIKTIENRYLLASSKLNVSTKKIFESFKLTNKPIPMKIASSLDEDTYKISKNDLEPVCFKIYPEMHRTLKWMSRFGQVKMTGSGSTLFCKVDENLKLDLKTIRKPAKITLFIVKGLSNHPFYAM